MTDIDYLLQTSIDIWKENGLNPKRKKRQEADHIPQKLLLMQTADDRVLLANTPAQAESLLHSCEQATGGIGLYVNSDKIELMFQSKWCYLSK